MVAIQKEMTQTEKKQIEELRQDLVDLKTTMDKIVMYLVDDNNSSSKGVVSRVNELEEKIERIHSFTITAKWVIGGLAIPIVIEVVRWALDSVDKLKAYGII